VTELLYLLPGLSLQLYKVKKDFAAADGMAM